MHSLHDPSGAAEAQQSPGQAPKPDATTATAQKGDAADGGGAEDEVAKLKKQVAELEEANTRLERWVRQGEIDVCDVIFYCDQCLPCCREAAHLQESLTGAFFAADQAATAGEGGEIEN